jgi:hypothetical protein
VTRLTARRITVDAYSYESDSRQRDAIDLELDGSSLSGELDVAPYRVDEIVEQDLPRRWLKPGHGVPLFNCTCGIPECGGIDVDVAVAGNTVEWVLSRSGQRVRFDRQAFYESLRRAMANT